MSDLSSVKSYIEQYIPECTELYEVVKVFEAVKGHVIYRFEVVSKHHTLENQFDVNAYYRSGTSWKRWTQFPDSYSDSAEGALLKAMGWFREYSAKAE